MGNINFDQPSMGQLSSDKDALTVFITGGSGMAIRAERRVLSEFSAGVLAGKDVGVFGRSLLNGVVGETNNPAAHAVLGQNFGAGGGSISFLAVSTGFLAGTDRVFQQRVGVYGESDQQGVMGHNTSGSSTGFLAGTDPVFQRHAGVYGQSDHQGVMGLTTSTTGTGVYGGSTTSGGGSGIGVRGETESGVGVQGQSFGEGVAIVGKSFGKGGKGVAILGECGEGVAIQGQSHSGGLGLAGRFIGNVHVQGNPGTSSGDLRVEGTSSFGGTLTGSLINASGINCSGAIGAFDVVLSGADCAEDFEVTGAEAIDPGTVMVIDGEGALAPCQNAYDKRVTGVISGAGDYKPGIVLDKRPSAPNRLPLALIGKVYCKVDAAFGSVAVGDLLTTSATHGHAMKANDPAQAFGAVIGKALRPLVTGRGLIPILVALQ